MYIMFFLMLISGLFSAGVYVGYFLPIIAEIIFIVIAISIKPHIVKKDPNQLYKHGFVSALYLSFFGGMAIGDLMYIIN